MGDSAQMDLAHIPHRHSLAADWATLGNSQWRVSASENHGAVILKASRGADLPAHLREVLPLPANGRCTAHHRILSLWQGPREWLLLTPESESASLAERLNQAMSGVTAVALGVTDRTLLLEVTGPGAMSVFAQGTSLDPQAFGAGKSLRTRFASLTTTVFRAADDTSTGFHLVADRTVALYLHEWFRRASAA